MVLFLFVHLIRKFFSQAQMTVLFDLPNQEDLGNWRPISVLLAPPELKEVNFDEEKSKKNILMMVLMK